MFINGRIDDDAKAKQLFDAVMSGPLAVASLLYPNQPNRTDQPKEPNDQRLQSHDSHLRT